jgi:hypothetical protein
MRGQEGISAGIQWAGATSSRHAVAAERPLSRKWASAIVVGGLAFSASLYPIPETWPLQDLLGPDTNRVFTTPDRIESASVSHAVEKKVTLSEIVRIIDIIEQNPKTLTVETLLTLTDAYGLNQVVMSLQSAVAQRPAETPIDGGGTHRSVAPPAAMPGGLPDLFLLMELLLHRLPSHLFKNLMTVIAGFLPQLAQVIAPWRSALPQPAAAVPAPPPHSVPAPAPLLVAPLPVESPGPATSALLAGPAAAPPVSMEPELPVITSAIAAPVEVAVTTLPDPTPVAVVPPEAHAPPVDAGSATAPSDLEDTIDPPPQRSSQEGGLDGTHNWGSGGESGDGYGGQGDAHGEQSSAPGGGAGETHQSANTGENGSEGSGAESSNGTAAGQ